MHLVRCGFANLVLADADEVEPSNLNRQHFTLAQVGRPKVEALRDNLTAINPAARIEALHLHVNTRNMTELLLPATPWSRPWTIRAPRSSSSRP